MKYQDRYDSLIQYYWEKLVVEPIEANWLLAKCQMLAESAANPSARSEVDAMGLFQLMSGTAAEVGVINRRDPEQSIKGGITYLVRMWSVFKQEVGIERIKFALGAYNCGLGNVLRAQDRALDCGLDPTRWVSIVNVLHNVTGQTNAQQTTSYVAKIILAYETERTK